MSDRMMLPGNSLTGPDPILQEATLRVPPIARGNTPISPIVHMENKQSYICTMPNASMHRPDGTRIIFQSGYFETDLKASIEYLNAEIALGHEYLRHATPVEIDAARMRIDPMGTMREKLRPEVERELRTELEAKIRAELGMPAPIVPTPVAGAVDEEKVSGTDLLASLRSRLKSERVTGATLIPVSTRLGGIVGSDQLAGNAAGSASGSGSTE